jgi:acetyltransferase-like isoleucine patch superfamily enzyme
MKLFRKIAVYCPFKIMRNLLYCLGGIKIKSIKDTTIPRGVRIGKGTEIQKGVTIGKKIWIGSHVLIKKNSKLHQNLEIGDNTIIEENVEIKKNCKIGEDVYLGKNVFIGENSIIRNAIIKENSAIEFNVIFSGIGEGKIKIGKESYIGDGTRMDWSDHITIGNFVHIAGPSTGIWTHTSAPMCINSIPLSKKEKKYRPTAPILIEDNIYIGGNCTIYPGITIQHHSVIAPNSAVTKDVEPFSMVGGVPAKYIKQILPEQ